MRLSGTVYSSTLEMDTGITIITPNQWKRDEPYNAVYLLHGMSGGSSSWADYSMLPVYAMNGNSIYILPDAARSFYTDMKYGFRYFTYITEELPQICRHLFHISSERENTAVMGCSMGGYGALKCALSKPEQYGMCGAFSSGCLFLRESLNYARENGSEGVVSLFGEQIGRDFLAIFGDGLEWKPEYEISLLAERAKKSGLLPRLYLTCGTEDIFYRDHLTLCKVLDKMEIAYDFEDWQARHSMNCFDDALKKAICKFGL